MVVIFWLFLGITEFNLTRTLPNIDQTVGALPWRWLPQPAQQVTVRIFTDDSAGSGVMIHHQQQNYTVLTNRHVVENQAGNQYNILTSDGATHPAQWLEADKFTDLDIAGLKFSSCRAYPVAKMRKNRQGRG